MKTVWKILSIWILALAPILLPALGTAADFTLLWDPNCDSDRALEGYYIYYSENASVIDDPDGADQVYVSVSDNGFDRASPSHQISNLEDGVRYCFTVTANYGDIESDMSNEICGSKSTRSTIIMDDNDPGNYSSGRWRRSGGADPYGTQSLYSREAGATYSYEASLNGSYEVALRWTYYKSRCEEVPVEIYDGDELLDTVRVNQKQNGGQFNVLGTYDFSGSATVVVVSETGNCSTCADAVSFSPTDADPGLQPEPDDPPPDDQNQTIIMDDDDPGSYSNGNWRTSGGADPYGTQSLYSREAGATYSYEASLNGSYEVALQWTYYGSRCEEVPVEIYDGDELLGTVRVNQKQNGGQFNVLGTYDFSGSATVVVVSETGNCSTCADAVQFQK